MLTLEEGVSILLGMVGNVRERSRVRYGNRQ